MPRDGSGTYTQPANTSAVNGAVIDPDKFNTLISDIASALTTSVNTSGTKAMAADLPMGGNKVTGLAAGTATGDAANMGNVHPTVLAKTANYTVLTTDTGRLITGDATSATFTLTLPAAASSSGMVVGFKKIDASVNTVIIDGSGSETIDGATTFTLVGQYDSLIIVCNGSAWYILPSIPATIIAVNITTATIATAILSGKVRVTGEITPTALAADTNDYAPTGAATSSIWRISASSAVKLTGIAALAAGTTLTLINVGTFNITLTSNDAASSAANRFTLPFPEVLRPGQALGIRYDTTLSLWVPTSLIKAVPVAAGFKNLKIIYATAATLTATADAVTVETTTGEAYRAQSVSVTCNITTSGANGLDTGAEASSTWYSIWLIYNPTTNTQAGLLSLSATAPTMPSGYTFKARLGWVRNNGSSNFINFVQYGRQVQLVMDGTALPIIAAGGFTASLVAYATTNFIPSTAFVFRGIVHAAADDIAVAPNSGYSVGIGGTNTKQPPYYFGVSTSGFTPNGFVAEFILEEANIYVYGSGNAASSVRVLGWEDNI